MFIIYGHRTYGKTDVVPGFFHVATKFAHIYYIPLFPTGTFLVLSESGNRFQGLPLQLSAKSVFLGWARAACTVITIAASVAALITYADPKSTGTTTPLLYLTLAAAAFAILSCTLKRFTHAPYDRALFLAQKANVTPTGLAKLRQHFNLADDYSPIHGFPVTPTTPPLPTEPNPHPVASPPSQAQS